MFLRHTRTHTNTHAHTHKLNRRPDRCYEILFSFITKWKHNDLCTIKPDTTVVRLKKEYILVSSWMCLCSDNHVLSTANVIRNGLCAGAVTMNRIFDMYNLSSECCKVLCRLYGFVHYLMYAVEFLCYIFFKCIRVFLPICLPIYLESILFAAFNHCNLIEFVISIWKWCELCSKAIWLVIAFVYGEPQALMSAGNCTVDFH